VVILILLIGLVFVGVAFGLFARSLLLSRLRAAEGLRQIEVYGIRGPAHLAPEHRPRSSPRDLRAIVDSLASRLGGLGEHLQGRSEDNLRRLLLAAGFYSASPRRFAGYQALSTLCLGGVWIFFAVLSKPTPVLGTLGAVTAILAGWVLPMLYLKRRGRSRARRIDYEMPELIDTLVTTVEAGIAFAASLKIASRRFRGALGDELRLTLQEQSMGLGLDAALTHMVERQDTPAVRSFVRSILQGEQLGVSVGQTLRGLAIEMRARRRQAVEERAHKAPVKLVFPLVLCIFPALLVIILGPAALRLHGIF
jgi:tight adherence protein C